MKILAIAAAAAALSFASPVLAQDGYPLQPAEYVEVTGIHIDDGYGMTYANHLATIWRQSQDFSLEQGWITGYEILVNVYPREGEPDVYLLTRFTEWTSPEEGERRQELYEEHMAMTASQMQEASAGRAEYRHVGSEVLLRRMVWDD